MSPSIYWRDILAWPFTRANCYDIAAEVCRRAGIALPALPAAAPDLPVVLSYVGQKPSDATRIGDLIIGDPQRKGYASHVAVVVEPGMALSTSVEGGAYCWPVRRHACQYGVWRA